MIILGLDPGLADTGWGVIERTGDQYRSLAYGSIKTMAGRDLAERLSDLEGKLKKIIAQYRPAVVAVEELFFAKNVKTALAVSQARGVILLTASNAGCVVREFTPLQVKMALTGYGRAEKGQIQKMVKTILSLPEIPRPDDAADALAIAICGGQSRPAQVKSFELGIRQRSR